VTAAHAAAGTALVAAAVHLVAAFEHVDEGGLHVAFFAVVTLAQLVLAWLLLRRPGPAVLLTGIWGTLSVVGVYVLSRTTGLPVGQHTHPAALGQLGHGAHGAHLPVAGGWGNGVPVIPQPAPVVEAVGALDLTALGAELAGVALMVGLLPQGLRQRTANVMLVLGVFLCTLRATRVLG
jgi:hypothetical protein